MLLFIGFSPDFSDQLKASFNTSHVVVYRLGEEFINEAEHRFNTSHVVVYQRQLCN